MRVLQILANTDDSLSNHIGIRFHQNLSAHGTEIRTLALEPGDSAFVSSIIPPVAFASWSPAAVATIRRELTWADLVVTRDALSSTLRRALQPGLWRRLRRADTPDPPALVFDLRDSGAAPSEQELAVADLVLVDRAYVLDESHVDHTPMADGAQLGAVTLEVPHQSDLPGVESMGSARTAARTQLGLSESETALALVDVSRGVAVSPDDSLWGQVDTIIDSVMSVPETPETSETPETPGHRLLDATDEVGRAATDIVLAVGPRHDVMPLVIDMMAGGVVPVEFDPINKDRGVAELRSLVEDRHLRAMRSMEVRSSVVERCNPELVYRQTMIFLNQALPSLP